MDNDFRFDEAGHDYFLRDRKLPSVTEIVNSVCGSPQYATDWHMNRGSMIHKALALYLQGKLNEKTVDERIIGRVEAGKKAIKELSFTPPYIVETPMYHPLYKFAGTPDLFTNGILVDWKSSHQKSIQPQGGGYILLLENEKHKVNKYYEIVLEDNRYVLNEYKPARCKNLFLAYLTVYQFKNNGT